MQRLTHTAPPSRERMNFSQPFALAGARHEPTGMASAKRRRDDGHDVHHRIALIGDAFMDINLSGLARLPSWGIDVPCGGVKLTVGGSCANTARQLASVGRDLHTTFFSCIGDDDMGAHFRNALRDEGLIKNTETSLHVLPNVPQSCCTILAGPSDRAMISCYTSNERVTIAPFRDALLASTLACFHLGGYCACSRTPGSQQRPHCFSSFLTVGGLKLCVARVRR